MKRLFAAALGCLLLLDTAWAAEAPPVPALELRRAVADVALIACQAGIASAMTGREPDQNSRIDAQLMDARGKVAAEIAPSFVDQAIRDAKQHGRALWLRRLSLTITDYDLVPACSEFARANYSTRTAYEAFAQKRLTKVPPVSDGDIAVAAERADRQRNANRMPPASMSGFWSDSESCATGRRFQFQEGVMVSDPLRGRNGGPPEFAAMRLPVDQYRQEKGGVLVVAKTGETILARATGPDRLDLEAVLVAPQSVCGAMTEAGPLFRCGVKP